MIQSFTYFVDSKNFEIQKRFEARLSLVGIQTKQLNSSDKYCYFEAVWDDADIPEIHIKSNRSRNAGAKPKPLIYNGEPATCGFIYKLRGEKNLSDAEIGMIFDVSESTIARRRKKHLANGNFYDGSKVIF